MDILKKYNELVNEVEALRAVVKIHTDGLVSALEKQQVILVEMAELYRKDEEQRQNKFKQN